MQTSLNTTDIKALQQAVADGEIWFDSPCFKSELAGTRSISKLRRLDYLRLDMDRKGDWFFKPSPFAASILRLHEAGRL